MLDGEQDVSVGAANRLRAVRAAVTAIRLELPRGATYPAKWELRFSDPDRGGEGLTVLTPTTTIWWSRGGNSAPEIRAEVAVQASGYEPMRQELVIPAEVTRKDVEFRLRALAPSDDATVVFTLVTDDAEFARRPFDLEIRDADKTESQVSRVATQTLADGRVRAKAPPGRWWLRLRPADGWCNWVYWEAEMRLAAGRENSVAWNVPLHGGARLMLPEREHAQRMGTDGYVNVSPASGGGGSLLPLELLDRLAENRLIQAIPVGSWRVALVVTGYDGAKQSITAFTVRAGQTADVVLEKPVAR
jgi:hypothetical protein